MNFPNLYSRHPARRGETEWGVGWGVGARWVQAPSLLGSQVPSFLPSVFRSQSTGLLYRFIFKGRLCGHTRRQLWNVSSSFWCFPDEGLNPGPRPWERKSSLLSGEESRQETQSTVLPPSVTSKTDGHHRSRTRSGRSMGCDQEKRGGAGEGRPGVHMPALHSGPLLPIAAFAPRRPVTADSRITSL